MCRRKHKGALDECPGLLREIIRRRPTLPGGLPPSTIGADRLNCRVRNGNGCDPVAMATGNLLSTWFPTRTPEQARARFNQALGRLVPVSSRRHRHYTSGLSTWWSSHGPYQVDPVRVLIFERVSHLDAFSGYPFRRWLISRALGRTTDTPELRPSRSSRTRDSFRQHSSGCGG